MSEHNLVVIPTEPGFVPSADALERATALLRRLVPSASVVEAELHDALVLVDCGGNFEGIACRACGAPVEIETWHAWMDADWDDARRGFVLRERAMPCCGAPTTLHALRYEWPMGFARCAIVARRHARRTLASHEVAALEACLGCAVRVIYQRY